jgi:hypothetical protein
MIPRNFARHVAFISDRDAAPAPRAKPDFHAEIRF